MRICFASVKTIVLNAILRLLPHRQMNGIRIVFADVVLNQNQVSERLLQSLALIKSTDARQYARVVRYIARIVTWAGPYSAATPVRELRLVAQGRLGGVLFIRGESALG